MSMIYSAGFSLVVSARARLEVSQNTYTRVVYVGIQYIIALAQKIYSEIVTLFLYPFLPSELLHLHASSRSHVYLELVQYVYLHWGPTNYASIILSITGRSMKALSIIPA